jgi:hypothetical protein
MEWKVLKLVAILQWVRGKEVYSQGGQEDEEIRGIIPAEIRDGKIFGGDGDGRFPKTNSRKTRSSWAIK